jgi:S-disulfanyl-L-cysteine oxidoreductase SoxD
MQLDPESKRAFQIIGGTAVALLAIGLIFSGRPGDAIYSGPPVVLEHTAEPEAEAVAEAPEDPVEQEAGEAEAVAEAPAEEAVEEEAVAEAPAEEAVEEEAAAEAPAEEAVEDETVAEAPAEDAVEEEAAAEAPAEEATEEPAPAVVAVAGDPAAGERVFRQCQACHQIGDGAANRVGPVLNDVIDRPAASIDGFRYSGAMEAAAADGLVWTVENLTQYLANPRGFVTGTSMAFAGLRSEGDIEDVIAYLATFE